MVSVENSNGQISPNGDLPQIHEVQRLLNSDDLESGAISPNQESNTYPKIQVPQNLNGLMSNEFRKV